MSFMENTAVGVRAGGVEGLDQSPLARRWR